ncbi:MAG: MauE/DoxX family redox-associated membrane protein [Pseudomonadota bacterium]
MRWITLISRLVVGLVFIYASAHKILDPEEFAGSIRNYGLIPPAFSNIVALTLPWLELVSGAFLILGIQTRASALLTSSMMLVFLGAIIYAYSVGLDIDCGCFSSSTESTGRIGLFHIFRDAGVASLSFWVLFFDRGEFRITAAFGYD